MRRSRIIVAMLAALILLAGLLLIPRRDEHLAMLTRDGRYDEASQLIAAMRAQGDARPELLMIQLNLYRKLGDVPRALESTRSYLAMRPVDAAALEAHADLLLHMGFAHEHLTASERLVRMRPDPERISHLLALLRSSGLVDREQALLAHFAGSRVLRLEHYERLGALLAAKADWQGAARWLRHVDRHAPADQSQARLKLLYVLLQSGQSAEAQDRAARWLGTWRDPYLSGRLILMLAQQSGEAAALPLALRLAETMPAAALDVAAVLTHAGQSGVSRALLSRWIDRTVSPSANEARGYVHASLAAGEARKPLQKLMSLIHESAQPEVIATFVEEIAHAYGPRTIAHLVPHLAIVTLQRRPLLAADLALAAGNTQLASWYLDKVDVTQLSEAQQDRWLELVRHVGSTSAVLERLLLLWERRGLPQRLIAEVAAQARTAGRPAIHDAIWASFDR